jgi:hypothetical protein
MPRNHARTRAGDLRFHLFERSIHPELFAALRRADVHEPAYRATLAITGQSHVIAARAGEETLVEVLAPPEAPLPRRGLRSSIQISRASRDEVTREDGALRYRGAYRVESYTPAEYRAAAARLLAIDPFERIKAFFDDDDARAASGASDAPFALIDFRPGARRLEILSVHAYPHELAIVYVETRFDFDTF